MKKLQLLAVGAAIALALSACGSSDDDDREQASAVACVPPYACGPMYVNYVPMYYQLHPYSVYMSPYSGYYNYSYTSDGRMRVAAPTGIPRRPSTLKFSLQSPVKSGINKTNTSSKTSGNSSGSRTSSGSRK